MTEQQEQRIIEVLDNNKSEEAYKILAKEFGIAQVAIKRHCAQMRAEGRLRDKSNDKWSPAEIKSDKRYDKCWSSYYRNCSLSQKV